MLNILLALYIVFFFINLGIGYAAKQDDGEGWSKGWVFVFALLSFFSFGVFIASVATSIDNLNEDQ